MPGSPVHDGIAADDTNPDNTPNRQVKKLQLRKAGFKAKDLSNRRGSYTRRRKSSSTRRPSGAQWTSTMDMTEAKLDSPSAAHNVLREISNSSRRVKKQSRARVDDSIFIYQDENVHESPKITKVDSFMTDESPCKTPGSAAKTKSPSKATSGNRLRKQSFSIDAHKYIEHLESELAAVQTQLAAVNSPTVMQAKSLKMRTLNAETRALQDKLADWERKFRERVQEEVEEREKIESGLKSRIRRLEGDAEDYAQTIKELTAHIDQSKASAEAAENANVELERRIDAISGFVASPKRRALERSNSSSVARHSRCKSTLPRFPTTGSLGAVGRNLDGNPATPKVFGQSTGQTSQSENMRKRQSLRIDVNAEALAALTGEDGSVRPSSSDASSSSSSNNRFTWATPDCYTSLEAVAATSNSKPSRRMRRFHAGTVPKPLLLPSTNSTPYARPATISLPQTQEESPSALPFPDLPGFDFASSTRHFDCLLSPLPGNGRRRALTSIEDVACAMRRTRNPFVSPMPWPAAMAKSSGRASQQPAGDAPDSDRTIGESTSFEIGASGRNLFEELQQAKHLPVASFDFDDLSISRIDSNMTGSSEYSVASRFLNPSAGSGIGLRKRAWTSHHRTFSDQTGLCATRQRERREETPRNLDISLSRRTKNANPHSQSAFGATLRETFHQTYLVARQSLIYAQAVTIHSATVQRLQWWIIQVLLGPQVSRRMMMNSMSREKRDRKRKRHQQRKQERAQQQFRAEMAECSGISSLELSLVRVELEEDDSSDSGDGTDISRGHHQRGHRVHKRRKSNSEQHGNVAAGQLVLSGMTTPWLSRHNPWLWIRFSIALLFAIGAALRDGPGMVMGVTEEEDKIE